MSDPWVCKTFGHKFRPRYSSNMDKFQGMLDRAESIEISTRSLSLVREEKYECDVCERCGRIVTRLFK